MNEDENEDEDEDDGGSWVTSTCFRMRIGAMNLAAASWSAAAL